MNQNQYDKLAFELAREYLLNEIDKKDRRVTPALLQKYLQPKPRPNSLPQIYEHLLESAQNRNMVSGVIKGGIGEISNLKPVLCGFEPVAISKSYTSHEHLLDAIVQTLHPKGKIRTVARGIWPNFCRTALQAAEFLKRFESPESFYKWADDFDCDPWARAALPLIIASQVKGLGFALACDFIKELGFPNYSKPDVQLTDIFFALGLTKSKNDPHQLFFDIARVSKHVGRKITPYTVDKIFWLIGSGKFYMDGFAVEGNHKQGFIQYAKKRLTQPQA